MPGNLGEISELKIAIDSLYSLHKAVNTIERMTGYNYFKDNNMAIEKAQDLLTNLKKKFKDL